MTKTPFRIVSGRLGLCAACGLALWGVGPIPLCAQEDVTTVQGIGAPLYVGNRSPILDPFDRPLPGEHAGPLRSLVELRVVHPSYGIIRPNTNGMTHPYNPLLTPESIGGVGLNTTGKDHGLFCLVMPKRPAVGEQIFARVYNAPTAAEATFYADSKPVALPTRADSDLVLNFEAARAIDWRDDDGDGLENSWENLLGIDDRPTPDYDGDGMSDLHEWLAGTAPDDPDSNLSIRQVRRETDPAVLSKAGVPFAKPVRVSWPSVPGKKYRLEHVPQLAAIDPETGEPYVFELVREVVAGKGEYTIDVWVDVEDSPSSTFRVKLVTE